ncbi:hypothetical protein GOBAR_DD31930 [Gossypium barbadense]|nr:hypothetical protein GOBAR_DD31930 [Gossypium barbadense]
MIAHSIPLGKIASGVLKSSSRGIGVPHTCSCITPRKTAKGVLKYFSRVVDVPPHISCEESPVDMPHEIVRRSVIVERLMLFPQDSFTEVGC